MQQIGISSAPNSTFSIPLNINGGVTTVQVSISWNRVGNFWVMNLADSQGNSLVNCVPLVTGTWPAANVLMPYQYLLLGSCYILNVNSSSDYPSDTNLGTSFIMVWGDNSDYVTGQQFGGNVIIIGPAGPAGPQGPPGPSGGEVSGFYNMGNSGSLIPSPGSTQFTSFSNLAVSANIGVPSPSSAGTPFIIQLIQPPAGGCIISWNSFYKGVNFEVDTTGNTQFIGWFQINSTNTAADLLFSRNGVSIS